MKRSLTVHVSSAGRSLRTLMTSATLLLALTAAGLVNAASAASAKDLFYTTSGAGYGFPNGAEIFAITVSGAKVTTRDIGPTGNDGCGSLALSPGGTLYSMCDPTFGTQRLATIDQNTGRNPVWHACPRTRCHGDGLRPQRDALRSRRLQP